MKYNYPLLHKVFEYYKNKINDISDTSLVCCQHILEPQLKMFELLIDIGFLPSKIFILGKAYSTNNDVLEEIIKMGIKVSQPKFTGTSFDQEHKKNCSDLLNEVRDEKKIVLIDDGAELIKAFKGNQNVIFAIEQTSSGFRKIDNTELFFPVVNVARSLTKLTQESPYVARLCFERITQYLVDNHIKQPRILVVGLGPIGESTLNIFKEEGYNTSGFDLVYGHTELLNFIQQYKPNVIVGATGTNVLSKEDIERLVSDEKIYFVSVSSSDTEFPVSSFRSVHEIHKDVYYKNIVFINNGFPITFKGNKQELSPSQIEKTLCLLSGSVLDGLTYTLKESGLSNVSKKLEELIN